MRELIRRLYYAFKPSHRIVVLDYPNEVKPVYTKEKPHKALFDIISQNDRGYKSLLEYTSQFKETFQQITSSKLQTDPTQPVWDNHYVPGLDIMILYSILCRFNPEKYIEIGSGTTTKTAVKARKENGLSFQIICIDPNPRQEIKTFVDTWHQLYIQDVNVDIFKQLKENDIVFFDGTHALFPNSDVMWFFLEVLPILPNGVIVQVHDIYIPYDYPQFMCDRYYSENYLLGALILNNPQKYEIIAPNFYISEQDHLASILKDVWQHPNLTHVEKHGGSFWFRIRN